MLLVQLAHNLLVWFKRWFLSGTKAAGLGTERFVEGLRPLLRRRSPGMEISRRERLVTRPKLEELFPAINGKADRNEWIYQAVRVYGYTLKEVANALGLYYSTVSSSPSGWQR